MVLKGSSRNRDRRMVVAMAPPTRKVTATGLMLFGIGATVEIRGRVSLKLMLFIRWSWLLLLTWPTLMLTIIVFGPS